MVKEDRGWLECKSNVEGNPLHGYGAGAMKLKIMVSQTADEGRQHHWDHSPAGLLSWWFMARKKSPVSEKRGKNNTGGHLHHSTWSPQTGPLVTDQSQMSMEDQLPCHAHSVVLLKTGRRKGDGVERWKGLHGSWTWFPFWAWEGSQNLITAYKFNASSPARSIKKSTQQQVWNPSSSEKGMS